MLEGVQVRLQALQMWDHPKDPMGFVPSGYPILVFQRSPESSCHRCQLSVAAPAHSVLERTVVRMTEAVVYAAYHVWRPLLGCVQLAVGVVHWPFGSACDLRPGVEKPVVADGKGLLVKGDLEHW